MTVREPRPNPTFCQRTFCGSPEFCEQKTFCWVHHLTQPVVLTKEDLRSRMASERTNASNACNRYNQDAAKLGDAKGLGLKDIPIDGRMGHGD